MIDKTCTLCSKPFRAWRQSNRFCSRACGVRGRSGASRRAKVECHCAYCGASVWKKPSHAKKLGRHYCSWRCKNEMQRVSLAGSRNPNFRDAGKRVCIACGKGYRSYMKRRRYCGVSCAAIAQQDEAMANLRRGTEAERKCMLELEARGFTVCRSAASKGPYDLIAMSTAEILLVQVKRTKNHTRRAPPKFINELWRAVAPTHGIVRKELWCWVDHRGWTITPVTGPTESRKKAKRWVARVESVTAAD